MASSSPNLSHYLKVVAIVILLTCLAYFPPGSVGLEMELSEVKIGSKPPGCVNRCRSCRPCMATLVIPPHDKNGLDKTSSHREDDSYYLLSWKCKCGNKLYQP